MRALARRYQPADQGNTRQNNRNQQNDQAKQQQSEPVVSAKPDSTKEQETAAEDKCQKTHDWKSMMKL